MRFFLRPPEQHWDGIFRPVLLKRKETAGVFAFNVRL